MPHATEGDLHAWLDGALSAIDPEGARRLQAHLDRCTDCAARLEEERAVRGRANELLGIALPAETPPPFERVGGRPTRGLRWGPERLAWAAGIVLALGAGWMGGAMLRGVGDPLMPSSLKIAAEPAGEIAGPENLRRDADDIAPTASAEGALAAQAEERQAGNERSETDQVAGQDAPGRRQALREAEGPPVAAPTAGAPSAGAAPSAARAAAPAAGEPSASADLLADVAATWRATDLDGAETWAGRSPIVIPDLEILDVAVADSAGERLVRVRHGLPDGVVIDLVARVDGSVGDLRYADESEVPHADELAAKTAEVEAGARAEDAPPMIVLRQVIDGIPVVASARLAPDSLAALLSRARSPEP